MRVRASRRWAIESEYKMIGLIIIGLIVLIMGKLKLTKTITLNGKSARWYGLTLILTALPFALIVGGLIAAITPDAVLSHPLWRRVINYTVLISYMVILALPFRDRKRTSQADEQMITAQPDGAPNPHSPSAQGAGGR